MKKIKYSKIVLLLLLIPALLFIHTKVENDISALIYSVLLLIVLWVYNLISSSIEDIRKRKIIKKNKSTNAKITSLKIHKGNTYILQLLIPQHDYDYITSCIDYNPDQSQRNRYKKGQTIDVFVNPSNPYEVMLPERIKTRTKSSGAAWTSFIWIVIIVASFVIPFFINFFDTSNRLFQDVACIQNTEQKPFILELRYESPDLLYLTISDPITNKTVKKIKDKKEQELDHYTYFDICIQNQQVVIFAKGNTPVYDVYDPASFEKISGIKEFEQSNKIMKKGIAKIDKKSINGKFVNDQIIEITTTDGKICFYNISNNEFYLSENKLENYIKNKDSEIMSKNLTAFLLSPVPDNNIQKLLYIVHSANSKDKNNLLKLTGSTNFDVDYFNKRRRYECKKCEANLFSEDPFLESKIVYVDSTIAVIASKTSLINDAEEKLTIVEKSGRQIAVISQTDYPNHDNMKKESFQPNTNKYTKYMRQNNQLIFLFKNFGGFCIDLDSGKTVWKYEP